MSENLETELSNLMQFLYACPLGLVDLTADGTIGLMNPVAMRMLVGLDARPFRPNFFSALEGCAPELRNLTQGFAAPRGTICANHRIVVATGSLDGAVEPQVLSCTLVKLSGERLMATLTDVSRQVAQERRLRQAETWFSTLLGGAEDFATLSLDVEGRIEMLDQTLVHQAGLTREVVLGATLDVFRAPDPDEVTPGIADVIALARRDGWCLDELWIRQADGGRRRYQRLIAVRNDPEIDGKEALLGYTAVLRTVAGEGLDATKLQRLLRTDHLTGASNRAHFFDLAERELRAAMQTKRSLAVVAIDVDHFKRVNDTHGHGIGDDVLKAITATCRAALRPGDAFARFGGEEFVVLLPGAEFQGASALAERLRAAVEAIEITVPEGTLRVTASFGCAALTSSSATVPLLLAEADKALYAAKRGGRNRVGLFEPMAAVA